MVTTMSTKTATETPPLHIDWLQELGFPGRIALSRCPKLLGPVVAPGNLSQLRLGRIDLVVCLLEEEEIERYGEPPASHREAIQTAGMDFHSTQVENFEPPSPPQLEKLLNVIQGAVSAGRRVLIHCMSGIEQAGTVAACLLVDQGMQPEHAISLVRWIRPGAIQSESQEQFIHAQWIGPRD